MVATLKKPLDAKTLTSVSNIPSAYSMGKQVLTLSDGSPAILTCKEQVPSVVMVLTCANIHYQWIGLGDIHRLAVTRSNGSITHADFHMQRELDGLIEDDLAAWCDKEDLPLLPARTMYELWRWETHRRHLYHVITPNAAGVKPTSEAVAIMYGVFRNWFDFHQAAEMAAHLGGSIHVEMMTGVPYQMTWKASGSSQELTMLRPKNTVKLPTPSTVPSVPTAPALKAGPLKLTGSVVLGDPVQGTSKSYRVVLLHGSTGARLAARTVHLNNALVSISFRVESAAVQPLLGSTLGNLLDSIGFDVKDGYASIHMTDTPLKLAMAYGAFVAALSYKAEQTAIALTLTQLIALEKK